MDPQETLDALRRALSEHDVSAARRAFMALDNHMSDGGFPPADWVAGRATMTPATRRLRSVS